MISYLASTICRGRYFGCLSKTAATMLQQIFMLKKITIPSFNKPDLSDHLHAEYTTISSNKIIAKALLKIGNMTVTLDEAIFKGIVVENIKDIRDIKDISYGRFQKLNAAGIKSFDCLFIVQNVGAIVLKLVRLFYFDEPCKSCA